MGLGPRLDLRQSQNLVMTPQLQQAIKLLQLSNLELADFVDQELERNPMLERDERDDARLEGRTMDEAPQLREVAADGFSDAPSEPDAAQLVGADSPLGQGADGPLDADYGNVHDGEIAGPGADRGDIGAMGGGLVGSGGRRDFDDDLPDLEATIASETSLTDHLARQLALACPDPADRLIGAKLVEGLDPCGWFTGDVAEIAASLGCPVERVEQMLTICQGFEPTGIFARGLKECLALQLIERDRYDPAMKALVENLELLANRDIARLKQICGIDDEDLGDMVREIRALNPKPTSGFDRDLAQTAVPDVLMRRDRDGSWIVELNPDTLPKVMVNTQFYAKVSRSTVTRSDKEYLSERFQTANWLVKSLQQRANTILKVASELVRQQYGFFEHGVTHLKPLVLRDIADAIEMHESTVSRVTSNKFIATSRGIFELKYFFTSSISGTDGESHSAEAVRHRIKGLIEAEAPSAILSDDRIVEILREEGIDIARRTVAKYRESMKISSSVQRRREKAMAI